MSTSTLGLESMFQAITAKDLLRQLITKVAPDAASSLGESFDKQQFVAFCQNLRSKDPAAHKDLVCALNGIGCVSADPYSSERLFTDLKGTTFNRFAPDMQTVQNAALWAILNKPRIWERVSTRARALHEGAYRWQEFHPTARYAEVNRDVKRLREAVTDFLKTETLHGEHVHIEYDEEEETDRYFVSVNSLPANVQQFDPSGSYAVARDANAINIVIEHRRGEGVIRLRSPLGTKRTRALAAIFAHIVLDCDIKPNEKPKIDLDKHARKPFPSSRISGIGGMIQSIRRTSIAVSFESREGVAEELAFSTTGRDDPSHGLEKCLEGLGVDASRSRVTEMKYAVCVLDSRGKETEIHVAVREGRTAFISAAAICRFVMKFLRFSGRRSHEPGT